MKAPDKIYATVIDTDFTGFTSLCPGLFARFSADSGYEEYIRKDALLEWANNMKRICKGAEPIEKAYQTMIEKIESL